jgi:hypothetical protein
MGARYARVRAGPPQAGPQSVRSPAADVGEHDARSARGRPAPEAPAPTAADSAARAALNLVLVARRVESLIAPTAGPDPGEARRAATEALLLLQRFRP